MDGLTFAVVHLGSARVGSSFFFFPFRSGRRRVFLLSLRQDLGFFCTPFPIYSAGVLFLLGGTSWKSPCEDANTNWNSGRKLQIMLYLFSLMPRKNKTGLGRVVLICVPSGLETENAQHKRVASRVPKPCEYLLPFMASGRNCVKEWSLK